MLRHGADINKGSDDKSGWKALHNACYTGNVNLVQILLSHHCDTNMKNTVDTLIRSTYDKWNEHNQTTAFHVIDHNSEHFATIVNMLVEYGADINIPDRYGNTILQTVLMAQPNQNRGEIVQFLLDDCNADFLTLKNHNGKTAWDISFQDNTELCHVVIEQKR
jgi:ankyrin repeat protein